MRAILERNIQIVEVKEKDDGCYVLTSAEHISDETLKTISEMHGIIGVMRVDTGDATISFKATARLGMGSTPFQQVLGTILLRNNSGQPKLVIWTDEFDCVASSHMLLLGLDEHGDGVYISYKVDWPGHFRLKVTRR